MRNHSSELLRLSHAWFFCTIMIVSCADDLRIKTVGSSNSSCSTEAENCPLIERLSPIVAKPGATLTAYGKYLSPRTKILANGAELQVTPIDENSLSFIMPDGANGFVTIHATDGGKRVALAASSAKVYRRVDAGFPVITLDPALVCSDIQYIDAEGALQQGSKICSVLNLENLSAENIKAGVTIGDVAGTLAVKGECTADGEIDCLTSSTFPAAGSTGLAAKVLLGQTVAGVDGSANASAFPTCNGANQSSCVSTATFKTMDLSGATVMTDLSASNFNTAIATASNFEFWDSTGARYQLTGDADLTAANIANAVVIHGLTGTAGLEGHIPCTAANQVGCVSTATYKSMDLSAAGATTDLSASNFNATLATAANFEFWDSNGARYQVSGDSNFAATNIRSGTTLFGVLGTLTPSPSNCASNGSQSCVATGSYFAATSCTSNGSACYLPTYALTTQPLKAISFDAIDAGKASIRDSLSLGGVTGTLADCVANNVSGCVTSSSYKSADWTNLTAANIKNSTSIAGVTGTYPSAGNPLASATAATDLTLFITQLTTDGAFEFFDSAGSKYSGSGDSDLLAINVRAAVVLENFSITGTATASAAPSAWDVRVGTVINGVTGQLKVNCRNRANSSYFDADTMPPGNVTTTAGSTLDWWDTIDDFNSMSAFPTETVNGWTSDTDCGKEVWDDLTAGGCTTAAKDCVIKDRISGLHWSESYPAAGVGPATTTATWSAAVEHCNNLNFSGTGWRLPTQKEALDSYSHGIRLVMYRGMGSTARPGGDTLLNNSFFGEPAGGQFWTATSETTSPNSAWFYYPEVGGTGVLTKATSGRFFCVR